MLLYRNNLVIEKNKLIAIQLIHKKLMKCVFNKIFTEPNPPTNLLCPQSSLDISLEISWTAPAKPNGLIFRYQIDVSPGNLQVNTSSNETHKNVEGLSPGMT